MRIMVQRRKEQFIWTESVDQIFLEVKGSVVMDTEVYKVPVQSDVNRTDYACNLVGWDSSLRPAVLEFCLSSASENSRCYHNPEPCFNRCNYPNLNIQRQTLSITITIARQEFTIGLQQYDYCDTQILGYGDDIRFSKFSFFPNL